MTTFDYLHRVVLPAAYALLPARCASSPASAMLLAIALQESAARHRRQKEGGPARGFWQFERIGVLEVLTHSSSGLLIRDVLEALGYPPTVDACYAAIEHNDVLAACFARLALWRLPRPLPARDDADEGWRQYVRAWRPGKPHPQTWADYFARGWSAVEKDSARLITVASS